MMLNNSAFKFVLDETYNFDISEYNKILAEKLKKAV